MLQSAHEGLQADHPDSPTTDSIATVLNASRPPSLQRVQQLIKEVENPKKPGADDTWAELQRVAEPLRQELPNASVTDSVTRVVDADDRPTDDRARVLLDETEELFTRIREVREVLDDADEGAIVMIEK